MDLIAPTEYTGKIIELINESRGETLAINSLSLDQIQVICSIPLAEVIIDFYDKLKSGTKGYASMSYEISGYKKSNLLKIDILLNGKLIEPLSIITHKLNSEAMAKRICAKLKELIPRQQVEVAIQAVIGSKVIARETIKPFRKDVTAKLYGGDISRRMKLLDKQKEGKKRMKNFANVNIPNDVFLNMLKG
jgi:GTP-binding protein LepA